MGLPATLAGAALSADAQSILQSVIAMGLLTLIIFCLMYATRIPAMQKAGIDPQRAARASFLSVPGVLPTAVQHVADNYNHLFEAPTLFYAMALTIVLLGLSDSTHAACAWAHVYARMAHSLIQCTANIVTLRFTAFLASWVAMGIMIVRAAVAVFM